MKTKHLLDVASVVLILSFFPVLRWFLLNLVTDVTCKYPVGFKGDVFEASLICFIEAVNVTPTLNMLAIMFVALMYAISTAVLLNKSGVIV